MHSITIRYSIFVPDFARNICLIFIRTCTRILYFFESALITVRVRLNYYTPSTQSLCFLCLNNKLKICIHIFFFNKTKFFIIKHQTRESQNMPKFNIFIYCSMATNIHRYVSKFNEEFL